MVMPATFESLALGKRVGMLFVFHVLDLLLHEK